MQNLSVLEETEETRSAPEESGKSVPTVQQLRLVTKKIPMKFCEFKISNCATKMLPTDTISISNQGILFNSTQPFVTGTLMRVWIEMPDYWARKARLVGYRHTEAPTYFQVLTRVIACEEACKRHTKFQLACHNVNLDPIDESVLNDYLGCEVNG